MPTTAWVHLGFVGCLSALTGCGTTTSSVPNPADDSAWAGDPYADIDPHTDGGDVRAEAEGAEADGDLGDDDSPWQPPDRPVCSGSYAAPQAYSLNGPSELIEASGITASWLNPTVVWLHGDSGTTAEIYAAREDGTFLGTLSLSDTTLVDPEDIATAPCPAAPLWPCLWLADTGDNNHARNDAALYAIAEPEVPADLPFVSLSTDAVWRFPLSFGAGAVDVEALAMSPDGLAAYLFEKVDASSARIFVAQGPFAENAATTATTLATLITPGVPIAKGRMITAADLHPEGSRLLLRVYTGIFEYLLDGRAMEELPLITPRVVAWGPVSEGQGEAVAYAGSGIDVLSISEDPDGVAVQPLHRYACTP